MGNCVESWVWPNMAALWVQRYLYRCLRLTPWTESNILVWKTRLGFHVYFASCLHYTKARLTQLILNTLWLARSIFSRQAQRANPVSSQLLNVSVWRLFRLIGFIFFIIIHIMRLKSVDKPLIFQEVFNNSSSDTGVMENNRVWMSYL